MTFGLDFFIESWVAIELFAVQMTLPLERTMKQTTIRNRVIPYVRAILLSMRTILRPRGRTFCISWDWQKFRHLAEHPKPRREHFRMNGLCMTLGWKEVPVGMAESLTLAHIPDEVPVLP